MVWIWLGVIILATVIEFLTLEMTSIWFAAAAFVALILSLFDNVEWYVQVLVFVVLSAALILFLRKIAKKWLLKRTEGKTNLDIYVGTRTRLLKSITEDAPGEIKINDVVWTAVTADGSAVPEHEFVEITGVKGNKIIVKKQNKTEE